MPPASQKSFLLFCRHDIIVAMDEDVLEDILTVAGGPSDKVHYLHVCPDIKFLSNNCSPLAHTKVFAH